MNARAVSAFNETSAWEWHARRRETLQNGATEWECKAIANGADALLAIVVSDALDIAKALKTLAQDAHRRAYDLRCQS